MRAGRALRAGVGLLGLLLVSACIRALPWTDDMVETPAVQADEALRLPPEGSLHTTGEISQSRFLSAATLRNPLPDDPATRDRGAGLFKIYCLPCHGAGGHGDGGVGAYFTERPPIDLAGVRARAQADGYIYATIRDGGGAMPALGNSLSAAERWAVVRFVRSLQQ